MITQEQLQAIRDGKWVRCYRQGMWSVKNWVKQTDGNFYDTSGVPITIPSIYFATANWEIKPE